METTTTEAVELLTQAASALRRQSAAAARWSPSPWFARQGHPASSVRTETGWEVAASPYADASMDIARYIAMLHPAAADALATCFETVAESGRWDLDFLGKIGRRELVDVAREVLRAPASSALPQPGGDDAAH